MFEQGINPYTLTAIDKIKGRDTNEVDKVAAIADWSARRESWQEGAQYQMEIDARAMINRLKDYFMEPGVIKVSLKEYEALRKIAEGER